MEERNKKRLTSVEEPRDSRRRIFSRPLTPLQSSTEGEEEEEEEEEEGADVFSFSVLMIITVMIRINT